MDRGKPSIGGETANQRLPSDGVGVRRPHALTPGQGKQKGKAAEEKRDRDQEGTQDRDSRETTHGSLNADIHNLFTDTTQIIANTSTLIS